MKCNRCNAVIKPGEERDHHGQCICEDCYMVALSPIKTCDPWAVHSAKITEKHAGDHRVLMPIQQEILQILKENGAMEPSRLLELVTADLQLKDLEREFSTLRHMEKVKGKKEGDKILWTLW
ncbi:hypothetical protein [Desulfocicer niacini]